MAVETYVTLLHLKLVVPASKSNNVVVERDYWISALADRLSDVDEQWYCDEHPDVAAAVKNGSVPSPRQHYCELGYPECQMLYGTVADDRWYLRNNEDVGGAVSKRLFTSAPQNFESVGYNEGCWPYASFALRSRNIAGQAVTLND